MNLLKAVIASSVSELYLWSRFKVIIFDKNMRLEQTTLNTTTLADFRLFSQLAARYWRRSKWCTGDKDEGYAIDWRLLLPGRLVSGMNYDKFMILITGSICVIYYL